MMEDNLWWKTTDTDTDSDNDTDTITNTDGGGWLLVKFPFKRAFPTAAVCAAVRHFYFLLSQLNPKSTKTHHQPQI